MAQRLVSADRTGAGCRREALASKQALLGLLISVPRRALQLFFASRNGITDCGVGPMQVGRPATVYGTAEVLCLVVVAGHHKFGPALDHRTEGADFKQLWDVDERVADAHRPVRVPHPVGQPLVFLIIALRHIKQRCDEPHTAGHSSKAKRLALDLPSLYTPCRRAFVNATTWLNVRMASHLPVMVKSIRSRTSNDANRWSSPRLRDAS